MPIYEYKCEKCGHQLEVLQSISDQPLVDCPVCHASSLNKLISSSNFHLKGTGWYVTDFRDKGKPDAQSAPPSSEKPADSSASSTTEQKTANPTSAESTKKSTQESTKSNSTTTDKSTGTTS